MIKTKRLITGLLFLSIIISSENCLSQDSLRKGTWTVSTNVAQFFLGDISVYGEYCFRKGNSIGVSYGIISPIRSRSSVYNSGFQVNDDLYPYLIYTGYTTRLYAKFHVEGNHRIYFSPLIMYKELRYSHYLFHDQFQQGEYQEHYERSETAKVISLQMLWGKEFPFHGFLIDCYTGLGLRARIRSYYNFNCCIDEGKGCHDGCPTEGPGSRSRTQFFPDLHLGLRVGLQHSPNKKIK